MPRPIAITRKVSPDIARCELTHVRREPIDVAAARTQHEQYETCLAGLGCDVRRLPDEPGLPDAVFVEDTAVVLDEVAVITRPGAVSRRMETATVAAALRPFRTLRRIEPPGTLDGGDVLRAGRTLYVGGTARSNDSGIDQLRAMVEPLGYEVKTVEVRGCLHLKSAATLVGERTVLINPDWVDAEAFAPMQCLLVDPSEPAAANVLLVGETVVLSTAHPLTRERLVLRGIEVRTVNATELAKAEGGVTCCSLIFDP
jgi:dimethylargininase